MSKVNKSHKKGVKTSTKGSRNAAKRTAYAAQASKSHVVQAPVATVMSLPSGPKRYCSHSLREARRKRAIAMKKISDGQTPQERVKELDYRLGVGCGAKKNDLVY